MFYNITWEVTFTNDKGTFELRTLEEIEVESSVNNLVDTATIILPEAVLNTVLDIEDKISKGTKVVIKYGYDDDNKPEFVGYVNEIIAENDTLKINCEDALYLFRKKVKDVELKSTTVKKIAQTVINQIDNSFKILCNYDLGFEKFVMHHDTGYDVLKKIQEETAANIYFDSNKKILHIHEPYIEKGGEVNYSPQKNLKSISLEYKKKADQKIEVTIENIGKNGKTSTYKTGVEGGETFTKKTSNLKKEDVERVAKTELIKRSADGYEGSIDTWLIPYVAPTYTAIYKDFDYPEKAGSYYVVSVKTTISASGGKRTVQLGIKL